MANNSLLAVGTVAFDAIDTPFGSRPRVIGGAATYITLAASYYTQHVGLVAVVGDDFPQEEIAHLNSRGINTEGLQIKQGEKSFFWHGSYHLDMNSRDTLTTELNVLANFDPIIPQSQANADYLMLGNLTPAVQLQTLQRMAKRPKLVVMDTMNFWMDIALEELKQVIAKVDVLTINDEEARQLSGERSLRRAARLILQMGPNYLIIKKGEHGAMLFGREESEIFFAPALPLEEVVDPTGAGDTFAGGFVGYLAHHNETGWNAMRSAIIHGSAMASFCVEKFGPEGLKDLTKTQIDNRVDIFRDLVRF